MSTKCGTYPGNKFPAITSKGEEKKYNGDYKAARELMNILFEQKIIREVFFEIQDSYATCTLNFDPKNADLPRYFLQGTASYQSTGSGKTEQEAFFNALTKTTLFSRLNWQEKFL